MPHFTYTTSAIDGSSCTPHEPRDETVSHPFHFSALFQSSVSTSPSWSVLRSTPRITPESESPKPEASFIGFSWGPPRDAFLSSDRNTTQGVLEILKTPRLLLPVQPNSSPSHGLEMPSGYLNTFTTPVRPYNGTQYHTLPQTSTTSRTPMRRAVSDREAMRQLVDCIGMSARKKVLASGRKPRILDSINHNRTTTVKKELRFEPPPIIANTDGTSDEFPPVPVAPESEATESESEGPPSPSPSPRPGSAMSILSRRSTTPTPTASHSTRFLGLPLPSLSGVFRDREYRDQDDEALSRLENRHAVLVSQLYSMEAQIDRLKELVEP